jgi:hypothetical protein
MNGNTPPAGVSVSGWADATGSPFCVSRTYRARRKVRL